MSKYSILLLGANGQVGHALKTTLALIGEVTACTRAELDLSIADQLEESIDALVTRVKPAVIVNATAYTAVDQAESEPDRAQLLNARVPGLLARAAEAVGACMVHYSTDYVFDGKQLHPYQETDATNPLSVYGRTKLQGEQAVAIACRRHLLLRTSWVVSAHGGNFLKTMLKAGQERDSLRVVADQFGAPTSARLIAQVTADILVQMVGQPAEDPRWGLYHLVAAGQTNWHAYAQYVLQQARIAGWPIKVDPARIAPIAAADYPVAAARPMNSRLDTQKIRQTFGLTLPDWTLGVDEVLADLKQSV
jgi:dTDP-4-dehydrorhamnose reductase